MGLAEVQAKHSHRLALLILYAESLGFVVTLGDCYRDPRCSYGAENSAHKRRLATDLNLFSRGPGGRLQYLTATEDHRPLGEHWERMGGVWGGRFSNPAGNHYETPWDDGD